MSRTETVEYIGVESIPSASLYPESRDFLRSLNESLGGGLDVRCLHAKEGGGCVVSTNLFILRDARQSRVSESAYFPENAVKAILARIKTECVKEGSPLVLHLPDEKEQVFSVSLKMGVLELRPLWPERADGTAPTSLTAAPQPS